jgi:hypothetical protein
MSSNNRFGSAPAGRDIAQAPWRPITTAPKDGTSSWPLARCRVITPGNMAGAGCTIQSGSATVGNGTSPSQTVSTFGLRRIGWIFQFLAAPSDMPLPHPLALANGNRATRGEGVETRRTAPTSPRAFTSGHGDGISPHHKRPARRAAAKAVLVRKSVGPRGLWWARFPAGTSER